MFYDRTVCLGADIKEFVYEVEVERETTTTHDVTSRWHEVMWVVKRDFPYLGLQQNDFIVPPGGTWTENAEQRVVDETGVIFQLNDVIKPDWNYERVYLTTDGYYTITMPVFKDMPKRRADLRDGITIEDFDKRLNTALDEWDKLFPGVKPKLFFERII